MNPLQQLGKFGQSPWLDYIRRDLVTSGELKRLVLEDGLGGMTSNPTIFEKAITGSTDYDSTLRSLLAKNPHAKAITLYEALAIEDIQMAADVLRLVYDRTAGADGYVSLEVSPKLAHDTAATIAEARRLWKAVNRPNLMIKVPATPEGIPAVETLLAEGINVNITLMFSMAHYEAVAQAYLRGASRCPKPKAIASVASFFVSRVDTAVDKALEAIGSPEALALRGKAAIANTKKVYQRFREIFYGDAFAALRKKGVRVQRPLWASTSTKNPAYLDVMYVEELIGKDTVNTLPPATLEAYRDHGRPRMTIEEKLDEAQAMLDQLKKLKIDLDVVTQKLQVDGVASFAASFDQLMPGLEKKVQAIAAAGASAGSVACPATGSSLQLGAYAAKVNKRLESWQASGFGARIWKKDISLWSSKPVGEISDRLGWLSLPETMRDACKDLCAFAKEASTQFRHVVLLGMGGSSLTSDVFCRVFGSASGYPELIVLDSTHPAAVRAVEKRVDLARTLFLVSSKSGTTTEPLSMFYYFWGRLSQTSENAGDHFIAISDPSTPLVTLAKERKFRRVFLATPDVGGRYSALTLFGLVSAALIGMELDLFLDRTRAMAQACGGSTDASKNPGLVLGAALGELALAGRDKLTFINTPALSAFPDWAEQLIAESVGKDGKGIVPVAEEPLGSAEVYGKDRVFVVLQYASEKNAQTRKLISELEALGHPVLQIQLADKYDIGQEFFLWEFAVAAAGAALGIHPFNQPDVETAKKFAREAMKKISTQQSAPASDANKVEQDLRNLLAGVKPGDYISLQAYLAPRDETTKALQSLRAMLRDRLRVATTLGYGPRFLHSTGQLHKGGPNTGVFLQIVDEPSEDVSVPETDYTFGQLIRAQAQGDIQALQQGHRRVLQINLGKDTAAGLKHLNQMLSADLAAKA